MKILMLGAGAIGGYLGARIHLAGGDMSFLARPARARQLLASGFAGGQPIRRHGPSRKRHGLGDAFAGHRPLSSAGL